MVYVHSDPTVEAGVLAIVMHERQVATSPCDLKARLQRYGYAISETAKGVFVTTLPHGVEVCRLPSGTRI